VKPDSALENYIRETMGLPAPLAEEETPEEEMAPDEEQDPGMSPEVDDAGNPIEPVDGETPDGEESAPGADQQSTLDDLNSELDTLEASDFDYESVVLDYLEEAEHYIESMSFVAKGGHLDEETKKKISEALKKRGGAARSVADTAVQKTKIVQDNFEKNVAPIRGEMDSIRKLRSSIPKGKKGTAQRAELKKRVDALREKINGLRSGKKDLLGKIKQGRMDALKTIKEVNAQLKARREMIRNTVNSIRAEMKQGGEKATANLMPLDDHIEKNREQADSLRAKLKSIPEGKEGKEQREAVRAAIKGLYDENRSIVKSKKQIRGELRTLRDTKRKEIDRVKSEFHEHHIEHDPIFSLVDNSFIIALQNECSPAEKAELKKKGLMFNVFEKQAPRPLTFAERRVNLAMMNKALDEFSSKLQEKLDEVQAWQKEDLIAQAKRAIQNNDIGAVATIATKYKGDLAGALTEAQKELFELGKQTASAEIQVPRPPTKSEVRGAMRIQNDVLVAEATAQMENATKKTVIDMLRGYGGSITDATAPAIVKELQTVLDNKAQKLNNSLLTVNTTGALNLGRATIFEKHAEKIYAFQYSAILDRRTTDRCRSLDGRVVKPGSSEFFDYTPPQHMNCRSIWVEILVEDDFKPEVTGIPSSIPAVGNIENAQDLKAPIILKNSPAITQIKDELKERKEKLALLEADGKYPNRQAAHKSRIADLEKSLKGKFQEEVLANVKNRCYSQSDL
jgi:SPP1 gp7 family putative phage head morphogenesis protein